MAVSENNRLRWRARLVAREVKQIFTGVPERAVRKLAGRWLLGVLLRWLFLAPDGQVHRAGEIVLGELRNRYLLRSAFSTDPLVMARRIGQREVLTDIINYLNLDEKAVQQLMEIDDGLG